MGKARDGQGWAGWMGARMGGMDGRDGWMGRRGADPGLGWMSQGAERAIRLFWAGRGGRSACRGHSRSTRPTPPPPSCLQPQRGRRLARGRHDGCAESVHALRPTCAISSPSLTQYPADGAAEGIEARRSGPPWAPSPTRPTVRPPPPPGPKKTHHMVAPFYVQLQPPAILALIAPSREWRVHGSSRSPAWSSACGGAGAPRTQFARECRWWWWWGGGGGGGAPGTVCARVQVVVLWWGGGGRLGHSLRESAGGGVVVVGRGRPGHSLRVQSIVTVVGDQKRDLRVPKTGTGTLGYPRGQAAAGCRWLPLPVPQRPAPQCPTLGGWRPRSRPRSGAGLGRAGAGPRRANSARAIRTARV